MRFLKLPYSKASVGFPWFQQTKDSYSSTLKSAQGLPLKPCRLPLGITYMSAYLELLWNLDSVTLEDYCEARAMYNAGIRYSTFWADQAPRVSAMLEQVNRNVSALNQGLHYTPAYVSCLTSVYELIYSPIVEGWPTWDACTGNVDAKSMDMYPEEYSSIIETIKRHGVEISNCRAVIDRQPLVANTAAKNYVSYSSLYSEVVNSFKAPDPARKPLQEYLRVKIHCALDAGFLSVREFHALGQRLSGGGVGTMRLD